MPVIVTCSICGRSVEVEHFEVYLRTNRKNQPMRVGAGGMDMCSVCWAKYAKPFSHLDTWVELKQRKSDLLARRKANDLDSPRRKNYRANA